MPWYNSIGGGAKQTAALSGRVGCRTSESRHAARSYIGTAGSKGTTKTSSGAKSRDCYEPISTPYDHILKNYSHDKACLDAICDGLDSAASTLEYLDAKPINDPEALGRWNYNAPKLEQDSRRKLASIRTASRMPVAQLSQARNALTDNKRLDTATSLLTSLLCSLPSQLPAALAGVTEAITSGSERLGANPDAALQAMGDLSEVATALHDVGVLKACLTLISDSKSPEFAASVAGDVLFTMAYNDIRLGRQFPGTAAPTDWDEGIDAWNEQKALAAKVGAEVAKEASSMPVDVAVKKLVDTIDSVYATRPHLVLDTRAWWDR